jgi:subfamily B ATP-binding cassette protein MsbA
MTSRDFSRRIKENSRERQRRSGSISTSIEQTLSNIPLVQAYDQGEREVARYLDEAEAKYRAEMASARLRSFYSPAVEMIELLGVLTVIGAGVWLLSRDELTVGALLAFLTFLSRLYSPIRGIGSTVTAAYSAAAGAERVIELLNERPMPPDRAAAVELEAPHGEVAFESVTFAYPHTERAAVRDVSFSVSPGDVVALVGASGAGKSTIARLLMRSYDPDIGRVTVDGHDLRDLTRASVRRNVSVLLQETLIVDGSVRDNIAFGRPHASQAEIELAAATADAHAFILGLPDGYATQVGERGRRLSGGQAQRLAIARALLRDAPILLLDEPTTGLDAGSTDRVTRPLRRLMEGRATLVISHHLMTVREATQILVLDDATIVERGTHDELITRGDRYADLWALSGLARHGSPTPIRAPVGTTP